MGNKIKITESQLKRLVSVINESVDIDEAPSDFQFFREHDSLEQLRDALAKNRMVSVAYVKKDGTVRHMLVRRHLSSYVASAAPKSDAQANLQANNDVKRVIDMSAYRKALKELKASGVDDEEAKKVASNKAWRTINLKEVLGFLVGGNFVDLRDENDIMEKYGEEVYGSLTKGMVGAMEAQQVENGGEDAPVEDAPPAEEMGNDLMEEIKRMKKIISA